MVIIQNMSRISTVNATYHVCINNTFIAKFKHRRTDGLGECLRKAGKAVDEVRHKKRLITMAQLEMGYEKP